MEKASSLTALHWNLRIPATIYNPNSIPIGLCTICHDSFEVGIRNSISSHDVIKVFLENHLSVLVFRLEVTASDGHHTLIC